MNRLFVLTAVLLAACGGSTGPNGAAGIDPSVVVVNQSPDSVRVIWASDQSGSLIFDTVWVAAGTTRCTRWLQSFDSLYVKVIDTLPNVTGLRSSVVMPWLHFSEYPYYFQRDTVLPTGAGIANHIDSMEC